MVKRAAQLRPLPHNSRPGYHRSARLSAWVCRQGLSGASDARQVCLIPMTMHDLAVFWPLRLLSVGVWQWQSRDLHTECRCGRWPDVGRRRWRAPNGCRNGCTATATAERSGHSSFWYCSSVEAVSFHTARQWASGRQSSPLALQYTMIPLDKSYLLLRLWARKSVLGTEALQSWIWPCHCRRDCSPWLWSSSTIGDSSPFSNPAVSVLRSMISIRDESIAVESPSLNVVWAGPGFSTSAWSAWPTGELCTSGVCSVVIEGVCIPRFCSGRGEVDLAGFFDVDATWCFKASLRSSLPMSRHAGGLFLAYHVGLFFGSLLAHCSSCVSVFWFCLFLFRPRGAGFPGIWSSFSRVASLLTSLRIRSDEDAFEISGAAALWCEYVIRPLHLMVWR